MKKILFGLSVFFTALMSAQIYQDYYPVSSETAYYNEYDDQFYFPDDYYYEYPEDYYTRDLYQGYYNDYRKSIYDVDWNRFFATYRLAPWQVQEIMMLNNRFGSYSTWSTYYRYNPDRWYYDRFFALERILGPRVYVIFQNNYYNGYNPVVYYQNYRRQYYVPHVYVVPRYRKVNVKQYRVDRVKYHQNNPRNNYGFRHTPRTANTNNAVNSNGFREGTKIQNGNRNEGFRNGVANERSATLKPQTKTRSLAPRTQDESSSNASGFRNNTSAERTGTPNRFQNNTSGQQRQSPGTATPSRSSGTPGMRLTSR